MKKGFVRALCVVSTVAFLFAVSSTPAYAVSYGRTDSYYPYQEECYGFATIYPIHVEAGTYCELITAGKTVSRIIFCYKLADNSTSWQYTYGPSSPVFNNEYSYLLSTKNYQDAYWPQYSRSDHEVKISRDSGVGWSSNGCDEPLFVYY